MATTKLARCMGAIARFLLPSDDHFFDLLDCSASSIAACTAEAAAACRALDEGGRTALAQSVERHDQQANEAIHEVNLALGKTFITPFDRADIHRLVLTCSRLVNQVTETVRLIDTYVITELPAGSEALAQLLAQAGEKIVEGVKLLRSHTDLERIGGVITAIRSIEDQGDGAYRVAAKALIQREQPPLAFFKAIAFLNGLEEALDQCSALADALENIAVKNV